MVPLAAAEQYAKAGHPVLPVMPGAKVPLADLVPRGGDAGRFLLGFATGAMLSVEHDGDRTRLQIIPPAA